MSDIPVLCSSCRKPKAAQSCELCQEPVCNDCLQFLDADAFSFRQKISPELSRTRYCAACFAAKVEPELEVYQEVMARAREVYFFFNTQRRSPPVLRRSNKAVKVEACADRDETILRLAFQAVEAGYNAILEADVTATKVRNAGYQKSRWQGTGVPATVDAEKLERYR